MTTKISREPPSMSSVENCEVRGLRIICKKKGTKGKNRETSKEKEDPESNERLRSF